MGKIKDIISSVFGTKKEEAKDDTSINQNLPEEIKKEGLPKKQLLKSKRKKAEYDTLSHYGIMAKEIVEEKIALIKEVSYNEFKFSMVKKYQEVKDGDLKVKKELLFFLVNEVIDLNTEAARIHQSNPRNWELSSKHYNLASEYREIINLLIRSKQDFTDTDYSNLFNSYKGDASTNFASWPIGFSLKSLESHIKKNGLSAEMSQFMTEMLGWKEFQAGTYGYGSDTQKAQKKIQKLLQEYGDSAEEAVLEFQFRPGPIGENIAQSLSSVAVETRSLYYEIFHLSMGATSGAPTKKLLKQVNEHIENIGVPAYKKQVLEWFEHYTTLKAPLVYSNGYIETPFADPQNLLIVKTLVWSFTRFHDAESIQLLGRVADRSYRKVPGVGSSSGAVGNAAVYTLANTKGLDGVAQLTKLKSKVTKPSIKNTIEKQLVKLSEKLNISISEIEEMAVPDFKLTEGVKEVEFGEYKLRFEILGIGKSELIWIKPNGDFQKTVPKSVKDSKMQSDLLKKVKKETTEIKKILSAQRNRIDNTYLDKREWDLASIQKYYWEHGLISFISKKLIWELYEDGKLKTALLWYKDAWKDAVGNDVDVTKYQEPKFRLWHPINHSMEAVLAWRNIILENEIVQPFKQAYREVYVLTDAEINTKTYSNRMAAHVLKQHQFNALSGLRGWSFGLMGAWDHGFDGIASTFISKYKIHAEFWTQEIAENMSDSGIWNYISTDQIRFTDESGELMELTHIPELVFSEIFRDVDMFVGVCSVGNDPEWSDNGGLPQYRDYWSAYSFGDLNEMANTRKQILENVVPRLKFKNVATIDGKFLVIAGKIRTYKIHMGSGNILMEPNDQYLCIVPDGKANNSEKVFLPFEGDRTLSLILSKAFLLADDDKITDKTIISQITVNK